MVRLHEAHMDDKTVMTEHQERILAKIIEIESRPFIDAYARGSLGVLYTMLERSEDDERIAASKRRWA